MPIDSSLYPDNWKELALIVKENNNWCCSCCGKRCYKPGERPENLTRSAEAYSNYCKKHAPGGSQTERMNCAKHPSP